MKLPNLFIIGAPKSGTTALYDTLKQHPQIYMSPVKEPFYFAFEGEPPIFPGAAGMFFRRAAVWRPHEYAQLFAGGTSERAIGEASATYLASPLAARRIRHNLPSSRIAAILRQPAERAYSAYTFLRQVGFEPARIFEEALAQEEPRIQAGWIPILNYKANSRYYGQLAVYYDLFPREQIKVYLYEDWKDAPQAMLRDMFRFLEVDENFVPEVQRSNVTRLPKNRRLHLWATNSGRIEKRMPFLPALARRAIHSAFQGLDSRFNLVPPPPLDPEMRTRLTADFREDILQLQDLIRRDLSHWLKAN